MRKRNSFKGKSLHFIVREYEPGVGRRKFGTWLIRAGAYLLGSKASFYWREK